ncbi:protein tyrosine kinase [Aquabacterium sp. NJ1]|uniref:XrtA-associated tyrosine autokinase n=1 Tax=Aquabacterium sp. NJ1 TaxID=1538295 RepID=UPI00052D19C7|nr:XrtA-associated tyrosine autokinase [Aquabacterium sp. NJ1]KGM39390.1 protein tyrosine kinase [Aquabacterium sp. NJ1]
MSTIERAAKRLEELRRAGVDIAAIASEDKPAPTVENTGDEEPLHTAQPSAQPALDTASAAEETSAARERRSREVELDLRKMSRANLLVPGDPRSQLEEEFRIIKRPLLENVRGQIAVRPHRANLIMVTSALPGEGKTQTAINLATSIAMELDHTVLLVEADVLRPAVLERMGVAAQKGLLDLLSNKSLALSDVLLKTNIPKLTLLPAGTASSRSTELLASTAMDELLEELASKYADRVIIFDTPPLLSTTESRVLASHMGQVVMVVESGKTPTSSVQQAFATVESHPVVLSMLNKYRGPKGRNTYGYYAP